MAQVIITLNPSETSVSGRYRPGDMVMVMCDATLAPFTVLMPDAQSADETTFRYFKIDNSENIVTLEALPNQKIMNEDTQELTEEADELVLHSNGIGWW